MCGNIISLEGFLRTPQRLWEIAKFTVSSRLYIFIASLLIMLLILTTMKTPGETIGTFITEWKSNNTGTVFNVVTIFFILAVWFADIRNAWHQSLDKYLSVRFFLRDNNGAEIEHLAGRYARLLHEADIRAIAQQIGRQNNNQINLCLDIAGYSYKRTVCYDRDRKISCKPFWHYEVSATLTRPPARQKEYLSVEEYLDRANRNLEQLSAKLELDSETEILTTLKDIQAQVANFHDSRDNAGKKA